MNTKFIRITISLLCFLSIKAIAQNVLTGKIINKANNTAIAYATVYIEDLKLGAVSDSEGVYTFKKIPSGTFLVEVDALGYESNAQTISVKGASSYDFKLNVYEYEENEVVVTGNSRATDIFQTPQPITEVPHDYLIQRDATNVIDALKYVPGVDGISDGQSIAKPVIRGLGYNRVVTVNDGVRQEGQQWGDEFGIEIDPFSVDRVEILKGPASLAYGSDAISGVINFLPEKTLPSGEIKGDILNAYQTNNGLINNAGHIAGNLNGITFSARVDNTMAHAYQNARDGHVFNSQFSNFNTDETIGIHRKWGFSQLHFSYFELRTGIVEGAKDATGNFLKQSVDENGNPIDVPVTNQELRSYTPFVINQLVKHTKLVWDNSVAIGSGRIIGRFAWQNNSRQENNDITIPNTSNIWYLLNTYNYDVRYVMPTISDFNLSVGVNGMYQNSQNKGTLLLIPEYDLFDLGAFAIASKKIGRLNISAGIRYDTRTFKGHDNYIDSSGNQLPSSDPDAIHRFAAYNSNFNGLSGSLGAAYQVTSDFYIKANVARGFRAPNVAETGSNGIHDGTVVYEIGQPNLKAEQSLEGDITPGYHSKNFTAEVSVFYNRINNFIYARELTSTDPATFGQDSLNNSTVGFSNAPVFLYSQTDATLTGGEAMLDIHPSSLRWFDWYTGFSIVNAKLDNVPDSLNTIPFVPPARLRSEITLSAPKISKAIRNGYFRFGVFQSFEQSNPYPISSVYYGLSHIDNTPAYTLLNVGLGADIFSDNKKMCSIYINIDNLTNLSYIDYMSRFKYVVNNVNGSDQKYVYNMGRNVGIKVLVPLDFSRKKP